MKTKSLVILIWLLANISLFSQTIEYTRLYFSVSAGMDYPIGISDTPGIEPDFTLPFLRGFGATIDGAFFITENFGVGLKYHLYSAKVKNKGELLQPDKAVKYTFSENTHIICPTLYGRWTLGNTKWEIPASIGIGYVRNKISNHEEKFYFSDPSILSKHYGAADIKSNSLGILVSTGICYRISPVIAISTNMNGLFSGAKKQKTTDLLLNKPKTVDISRKMNKVGISLGLNINF